MRPGTWCKRIWRPWERWVKEFCGDAAEFCRSYKAKTPVRRGFGKKIRIQRPPFERLGLRQTAVERSLSRNPKARVFQADGSYATITINTKGAFFTPMAGVVEIQWEGGPWTIRGARPLGVGPYAGGTLHAQVLAL